MLLQISNGAVAFGDDVVLHDINFEIRNTEKIAVVGRNGCGKTTLLKLINGEYELEKEDGDDVYYLEETNEFVVVSTDGFIRTYFCPDSGKKYFDKQ